MRTLPLHNSGTPGLSALRRADRGSARRRLALGCAAVGLATAFATPVLRQRARDRRRADRKGAKRRGFLPPFFVDAFVGAVGEIGQLAILYPVDTIKVRCQAQGQSTAAVCASVRQQGFTMANLRSLFAGCAPSAACAAVFGACYLASFCTAKRALVSISQRRKASAASQLAGASSSSSSSSSSSASGQQQDNSTAAIDTAAALVSSLLTSVLEAPVELFRHRMQAGLSQGRMLSNMAAALGGGGLGSLYWGYAPFLLKGIPYDVAELFSHSQLTKHQARVPGLATLPAACADCCIGALAGAAAVVFSMPADCIKTRMELGASRPPPGLLAGSAAFFRTGRRMLAAEGPRCMFTGLTPRLLENVPSTMFYWLLIASLRRALAPYTIRDAEPELAA